MTEPTKKQRIAILVAFINELESHAEHIESYAKHMCKAYFRSSLSKEVLPNVDDFFSTMPEKYHRLLEDVPPTGTTAKLLQRYYVELEDLDGLHYLRAQAGPQGPEGRTGPEGPQGPQGPQGEIGPQGPAATGRKKG